MNKDGDVVGKVDEDRNVYDEDGNKVGKVDKDNNIVDDKGNVVGKVDDNGNVFDKDGNYEGTIIGGLPEGKKDYENGDIVNKDGDVVGKVDADRNVYDEDGNYRGTVDDNGNIIDKDGNIDGSVDGDGNVYDKDGKYEGTIVGGLPGIDGSLIPGHDDFDKKKYLDDYYDHVEDGDKIRPTIDDDKCQIGEVIKPDGSDKEILIKGAEDYAICPDCKYPMSQWIPTGDGEHKRYCTNENCNHSESAACPYFYITVDGAEYHVCPICGDFKPSRQYEFVDGVTVGGQGEMNTLYTRGLANPFGSDAQVVKGYSNEGVKICYSFTSVQSAQGQLLNWNETLSLFIPMDNAENMKLVRMDRDGNFEEIFFMNFNGMLAFNTDCEGLYLLLAAE